MGKKKQLAGKKYGRLTVVCDDGRDRFGHAFWKCICDCGNEITVVGYSLESGNTKSCGCLNIERNTTHGMSKSLEYQAWEGMIQRCTNPNSSRYNYYGGRGIYICKRWRDFKNFFADMGKKPDKCHSIERRNNNKGYSSENCYWADQVTQMRNTRLSPRSTTGIKGVYINKKPGKKYRVAIGLKGEYVHLGHFNDREEAVEARRQGEIKYWGKQYA